MSCVPSRRRWFFNRRHVQRGSDHFRSTPDDDNKKLNGVYTRRGRRHACLGHVSARVNNPLTSGPRAYNVILFISIVLYVLMAVVVAL